MIGQYAGLASSLFRFIHDQVNPTPFSLGRAIHITPYLLVNIISLVEFIGNLTGSSWRSIVGVYIPDNVFNMVVQFNEESAFLRYATVLTFFPLFALTSEPGNTIDSFSFIDNDAEYSLTQIPGNFEFTNLAILETVGWWLGLIALTIKEYAQPLFKFDEVTLLIIAFWEFLLKLMDYGIEHAVGSFLLNIPSMLLLWFFFDRDLSSQGILNE